LEQLIDSSDIESLDPAHEAVALTGKDHRPDPPQVVLAWP